VSSGEVFVAEVDIGLGEAGLGLKIEVQVDFARAGDYFGPLNKLPAASSFRQHSAAEAPRRE